MSIQALREQRAAKCDALKELVNKDGQWTADDQASYDAQTAEIGEIDGRIERHQKMNELAASTALRDGIIDAAQRHAKDDKSAACNLFAKWLRGGDASLSAEDWSAHRASIQNTMSTTTNTEGGYTVPTEVATTLIDALKQFGGMRALAQVISTSDGAPLNYPTSDGTSEVGEIVAQNASATAADASFGVVSLPVYKYSSKVVTVPIELLQDSAIDIEAFVRGRLNTRLGRVTNNDFTTGTGTNQPNGVVTASGSGKVGTTGQTATVIYDDLVDLIHSVDPAYRELGNCRFSMNDASLKVIKKLKDSQGRPLFLPGYQLGDNGALDTILGYPVKVNQSIATMAANAKSILFGDFSFYVIRDAMQVEMFRFTDSAYAKLGQVGFLAFLRSGGNLTDVNAVKYYQNSAT